MRFLLLNTLFDLSHMETHPKSHWRNNYCRVCEFVCDLYGELYSGKEK